MNRRLTVMLDGIPMEDPHLTTVRIQNTGKKPVLGSEYVRDITVTPSVPGTVDDVIVGNTSPRSIRNELTMDESGRTEDLRVESLDGVHVDEVGVKPALLNPGDWLELQLLSSGTPGTVMVTARFPDQAREMKPRALAQRGQRPSLLGDVRLVRDVGVAFVFAVAALAVILLQGS